MNKRNFINDKWLLGFGSLLAMPSMTFASETLSGNFEKKNNNVPESPELIFFKNESNEFNFLLLMGAAHYQFTDIGELLAIREAINEEDPASFVTTYLKYADICHGIGQDCMKKGFLESAKGAYLRASSYYFAATYYLDAAGQADRFTELFKIHRDCWKTAAQLMEFKYEEFQIPYENTSLAGFFMSHKNSTSRRPLLIFNNGSDGSILDSWTMGSKAAFERGYNVMTFDGPGQGSSLFEKNLYFRYDWEKVITPVIDSVINRPDVDKNNIVLLGVSQGGYWVPRAAAFEKRLKAIVADPGVTDASSSWFANIPAELKTLLNSGNKEAFNQYMTEGLKISNLTGYLNFRARPYGLSNYYDVYKSVEQYNLTGIIEKIECHTIVTNPQDELFFPEQPQQFYDQLKCSKEIIDFTAEQGANYHCEPKARMFWDQQVMDRIDAVVKS